MAPSPKITKALASVIQQKEKLYEVKEASALMANDIIKINDVWRLYDSQEPGYIFTKSLESINGDKTPVKRRHPLDEEYKCIGNLYDADIITPAFNPSVEEQIEETKAQQSRMKYRIERRELKIKIATRWVLILCLMIILGLVVAYIYVGNEIYQ